jgi:hypothetical protein
MKKLNAFERHIIEEGLKLVSEKMKQERADAESKGKNTLMTAGFVDMQVDATLEKLESLTLKSKF